MPKFRKKPGEIEAFRVNPNGPTPTPDWFTEALKDGRAWYQGGERFYFTIRTPEGDLRADLGDWIIRGVKGELYPCKPDIFAATYEPVEA
jgi:hypothetical protein